MTKMTQEEIAQSKEVWADVYKFWKAYYYGENSSKFWSELVADADKMCEKHKGDEFFANLISVCVNDIEVRYKHNGN